MMQLRTRNCGYKLDALAKKMARAAEIDDIRQATAKKRRAFMSDAARLDDGLVDDNGTMHESRWLSDNGRGAETIRAMGEEDPCVTALTRKVRRAVMALCEVDRRIARALVIDSRPQVAARIAGTNRQRVYRTMAKLRAAIGDVQRFASES